jgi:hypothetical protein
MLRTVRTGFLTVITLLVAAGFVVLLALAGCDLKASDTPITKSEPITIANTKIEIASVSDSTIKVNILPPGDEDYFSASDADAALGIVNESYLLDSEGNQTKLEGGRMVLNWNIKEVTSTSGETLRVEDSENVKSIELELNIPSNTKDVKARILVCGDYQISLADF